jgi:DNA repair protein RadD
MILLRPHQVAAADAIEAAFAKGIRKPLVDMCVASGKSFTYAEIARRAIKRGQRVIISAHTRELVEQNADACRSLLPGVHVGINAAALGERCWRAPVISAAVQSIHKYAHNLGPIEILVVDECHLLSHADNGMYRDLWRGLGCPLMLGGSGTTFRLQGGSLVEGEGAPFDQVVYKYGILDGIRDGYLCEAFSLGADDKMDVTKLRSRSGEYTPESQDAQMIASMDNHIAQMVHHGQERRAWLVFEASVKAAHAMAARMNEWGIPTGLVLGETPDMEREQTIAAFRRGRLRALVNKECLTTGFNVPHVDLLVMRRATKSLGLYTQIIGRLLRVAEGKTNGGVLDFAGNIDRHGPIDCIQPLNTKSRLVSCDMCGRRNAAAAMRCWSCDAEMTKNCPACLVAVPRHVMQCPHCDYDMRAGARDAVKPQALLDTPSGAALLSSHKVGTLREGGWLPVRKAWWAGGVYILDDANGGRWPLPAALAPFAVDARWIRAEPLALLVPNGAARGSARHISADGSEIIVPMPRAAAA